MISVNITVIGISNQMIIVAVNSLLVTQHNQIASF